MNPTLYILPDLDTSLAFLCDLSSSSFFLSKLPNYGVKSNFMISRFKLQQIRVKIHENIQIQIQIKD